MPGFGKLFTGGTTRSLKRASPAFSSRYFASEVPAPTTSLTLRLAQSANEPGVLGWALSAVAPADRGYSKLADKGIERLAECSPPNIRKHVGLNFVVQPYRYRHAGSKRRRAVPTVLHLLKST
ncbi:hypothetical protein KCP73_10375 [Salmonella enterica subsp. enterica]|nr:hypothetical protein KCP73_10375 [Salmonella enterica subsp. enterica]